MSIDSEYAPDSWVVIKIDGPHRTIECWQAGQEATCMEKAGA